MERLVVFPDTQIFLHYKSLEQIDWLNVLGASHVTIVIAQIVIRELNKHKVFGDRKKLRHRADFALKKLKTFFQPTSAQIREGVEVEFRGTDPSIDTGATRLSPEIADDWLLATVMDYQTEFPNQRVILVTADVGLQLQVKAQRHHLSCMELPDSLKLPEEVDADQLRIRELQSELQTLRRASPDLYLRFKEKGDRFRFTPTRLPKIEDQEISRQTANIRVAYPKASKPSGFSGLDLARGGVGPLDIDRHNERLEKFYESYERYLRTLDRAKDMNSRAFSVQFGLENNGGCPARDIDIYIHIPNGITVGDEAAELCGLPMEPVAPIGPLSEFAEALHSIQAVVSKPLFGISSSLAGLDAVVPRNASAPTIRKTNSYEIHVHVQELKHNFHILLDPVFLLFDSWTTMGSFAIDYTLLASNVPTRIERQLHVLVG